MKINIDKLSKLERKYENNPITLNALQNMVNIIMNLKLSANLEVAVDYTNALETLQSLGVVNTPNNTNSETTLLKS